MNTDRPDFAGMTLNERLYCASVIGKWDAACHARNRDAMLAILGEVEIAEPGRAPIVDAVLADPAKYGF
jgi:hypothetical protein